MIHRIRLPTAGKLDNISAIVVKTSTDIPSCDSLSGKWILTDIARRSQGKDLTGVGKTSVRISSRSLNRILISGINFLLGFDFASGFEVQPSRQRCIAISAIESTEASTSSSSHSQSKFSLDGHFHSSCNGKGLATLCANSNYF